MNSTFNPNKPCQVTDVLIEAIGLMLQIPKLMPWGTLMILTVTVWGPVYKLEFKQVLGEILVGLRN